MKELTREELAHGRALLQAAFSGPWSYSEWQIECGACADDGECSIPECDGSHVPNTTIEALEAYPSPPGQVVAQISVPGLSSLADKNGEAICWLRNNAESLIAAREQLDLFAEALAWLSTDLGHTQLCIGISGDGKYGAVRRAIEYAKSLGWAGGTQ